MEPAPKRVGVTNAQAQCSPSTVTNENGFTPLTPVNDRGYSDTSEEERTGPSEMRGSSEYSPGSASWRPGYSPVSDVEPEQQKAKTEELCLAQSVQGLTRRRSAT